MSPDPRAAAIEIGDQRFIVQQPPGRRVFFAAAPSRLVFTVFKRKSPGQKSFSIISDDTELNYNVTATEPWVQVSAASRASSGARTYTVSVNPSQLKRGHNQGYVYVTAQGALTPPVAIPIVAEVPFVK